MKPPFKVGDRVRMTPYAKHSRPKKVFCYGTVQKIKRVDVWDAWQLTVKRDGASPKTVASFEWLYDEEPPKQWLWEKIPVGELTQDEIGRQLAQAFLDGDVSALDPLVDRILELKLGM